MTENILKVGIAGFGVVGKRRKQFIDLHPNLKTVAVCDQKFLKPGVLEDGVAIFQTHEQLLLNSNIDILFVCLPNYIAPVASADAIAKKIHVFCEKPPGRNLADVAMVREIEKQNPGIKLMYGFNHRYHESVREALRIIESQELGRVINLRGVYGKSVMINFENDWRTKREISGGGILLDQGIHMVDLMRLLGGEFTEVLSMISNDFWNHDVEDNAYAIMKTKSGVVGMLHSSATQWRHRFQLEIALEKGMVMLSGILSGTKSYGAETITVAVRGHGHAGDPKETTIRYNEDNSWRDEIWEFTSAVLRDVPIVSGSSEEAYKTMELVYKIYCADAKWKAKYDLSHST